VQVKTKNLVVGGLVLLLVGALWYRVVYSPMESKASKAKAAAHEADTTAANLRTALKSATSDKSTKPKDIPPATLRAALPADAAEATFLRSLDELRISSGVAWQSITPSTPTPSANITTVNVAVSITGTEAQLARYVAGLASLKRVFVLDNLSIAPGGSSAAPGSGSGSGSAGAVFTNDLLSAQIAGRIFSQATAPAPTTGATGSTGTSGTATTPVTGAPAPSGGATGQTGVQNN
jgi:Tfp pilus assembly protein PilO